MTTGHTQSQLMTPREVRTLLRVSATTLRALRAGGRLQAVRTAGGHHRYLASSPAIVDVTTQLQAATR